MKNNRKYNSRSNRSLENNFKQNKTQNTINIETGVINNPNLTAIYSDDTFAINYIGLALNHNVYTALGSHEGNEPFIKSILVPSFSQAAQLVSNYKVSIDIDDLRNYFNRISACMSLIMTCRQVKAYVKESGTINKAVYEIYTRVFDGALLQKLNILEQSIMQHYLPPKLIKDLVDHYTWRQSGKTAFSGIIGNTSTDFKSIANEFDYNFNKLNELVTAADSIYPIIAKISNKSEIDWAITSLPEASGTLSYDEEFTGRFINTPILQKCATLDLMCTKVNTTSFGSLVPEPSAISVLTCPFYKTLGTRPYIGFIDPRLVGDGSNFGIIVSNADNTLPTYLGKTTTGYYNEVLSAIGRHVNVVADVKQPVTSRMSLPGSMIIQNINETSLDVLYTRYMNYLFEVPSITKIN